MQPSYVFHDTSLYKHPCDERQQTVQLPLSPHPTVLSDSAGVMLLASLHSSHGPTARAAPGLSKARIAPLRAPDTASAF